MRRRDRLDLAGQLLQLERQRPQLGGIGVAVESRSGQRRRVEQGVEHQRQAWQDRLLDPVESLVEAGMGIRFGHGPGRYARPFNQR